jgi:hypothetical protein
MLNRIRQLIGEFRQMPSASIDLMYRDCQSNAEFYRTMVLDHYRQARRRHPRYLFVRRLEYGVALCRLPQTFDEYFMCIDGSARRNYKKAVREGCDFRPIEFNDHLEEICAIRQSSEVRQGRAVPREFLEGIIRPCNDPPSTSSLHGYRYFGVFLNDQLIAYAGCMIAGEICCLEQIWGHADQLALGAVPYLIIGIAERIYQSHSQVRYYAYGTYFGACETMQRFKRKLGFTPHHVQWLLDAPVKLPAAEVLPGMVEGVRS